MKTLLMIVALFSSAAAWAETRNFTTVAVDIAGTKFWIPSSFTVKKGDTVKITAISKVPGANNVHGFAIDAFKVQELVEGKNKTFTFTADKAGIFEVRCHLHPPHIGGQLIVLE